MKKPIYYSVKLGYARGRVIAITKVKGEHWWGRYVDTEMTTHGKARDLRGCFTTVEKALMAQAQVLVIGQRYDAYRSELNKQITSLYKQEQNELKALFERLDNGSE